MFKFNKKISKNIHRHEKRTGTGSFWKSNGCIKEQATFYDLPLELKGKAVHRKWTGLGVIFEYFS